MTNINNRCHFFFFFIYLKHLFFDEILFSSCDLTPSFSTIFFVWFCGENINEKEKLEKRMLEYLSRRDANGLCSLTSLLFISSNTRIYLSFNSFFLFTCKTIHPSIYPSSSSIAQEHKSVVQCEGQCMISSLVLHPFAVLFPYSSASSM